MNELPQDESQSTGIEPVEVQEQPLPSSYELVCVEEPLGDRVARAGGQTTMRYGLIIAVLLVAVFALTGACLALMLSRTAAGPALQPNASPSEAHEYPAPTPAPAPTPQAASTPAAPPEQPKPVTPPVAKVEQPSAEVPPPAEPAKKQEPKSPETSRTAELLNDSPVFEPSSSRVISDRTPEPKPVFDGPARPVEPPDPPPAGQRAARTKRAAEPPDPGQSAQRKTASSRPVAPGADVRPTEPPDPVQGTRTRGRVSAPQGNATAPAPSADDDWRVVDQWSQKIR